MARVPPTSRHFEAFNSTQLTKGTFTSVLFNPFASRPLPDRVGASKVEPVSWLTARGHKQKSSRASCKFQISSSGWEGPVRSGNGQSGVLLVPETNCTLCAINSFWKRVSWELPISGFHGFGRSGAGQLLAVRWWLNEIIGASWFANAIAINIREGLTEWNRN